MPVRRAVSKVRHLPEVESWAEAMRTSGASVQFLVKLDQPVRQAGRCYWPVGVRSDGKLWRRYLVSPDGKRLISG